MKDKTEESDRRLEESTKYKADIVEKDNLIVALQDQLESIAAATMCKARAEIFKEYMSGDYVKWNREGMQEEIDLYEEMRKLDESTSAEEAEGHVEKSPD